MSARSASHSTTPASAWADASARGRLITATGAGHYIHRDNPDLALAVIREALPPAQKTSR